METVKRLKLIFKVRVETNSSKEFLIDWKHKDLSIFKKCHEACREQAYGDTFDFNPFNKVKKKFYLSFIHCPKHSDSVYQILRLSEYDFIYAIQLKLLHHIF